MSYGTPTKDGNLRYDLSIRYQSFTDTPMLLTLKDAGDATEAQQNDIFQAVVDLFDSDPDFTITAWKSYTTTEEVTPTP